MRRLAVALVALALIAPACTEQVAMQGQTNTIDTIETAHLELEYPDVATLFDGEQGIYRGCAPNGGVCHNGRQYPDLRTLGALLDHIGRPCNLLRDDPADVHDWCETPGDSLVFVDTGVEIGHVEPADEDRRVWLIYLREPPPELPGRVTTDPFAPEPTEPDEQTEVFIGRWLGDAWRPLYRFVNLRGRLEDVSAEEGAPAMRFTAVREELDAEGYVERLLEAFAKAGVPGNPAAIQLGDQNGNGVFGAGDDYALVAPGRPEDSYLVRRLIDPEFGTLMPLANCCHWTRASLRALWCWIAGLDGDASNALDPIDYATCPDGPASNLLYPEPGPMCESEGLCPVAAVDPLDEGPTWAGVRAILRQSCAGTACHVGGQGPSDFVVPFNDDGAYAAVRDRVSAGSPDSSLLTLRLDPERCVAPDCDPMPLGSDPLPDEQIQLIRDWIAAGAPRDE